MISCVLVRSGVISCDLATWSAGRACCQAEAAAGHARQVDLLAEVHFIRYHIHEADASNPPASDSDRRHARASALAELQRALRLGPRTSKYRFAFAMHQLSKTAVYAAQAPLRLRGAVRDRCRVRSASRVRMWRSKRSYSTSAHPLDARMHTCVSVFLLRPPLFCVLAWPLRSWRAAADASTLVNAHYVF